MWPIFQLRQDSTEDGRGGRDARPILQRAGGPPPATTRVNENIKYVDLWTAE